MVSFIERFTIGPMISARFASINLAIPLYIVAATSVVALVWAYWAMPYWIGAGQMILVLILIRFAASKLQHKGNAQ